MEFLLVPIYLVLIAIISVAILQTIDSGGLLFLLLLVLLFNYK